MACFADINASQGSVATYARWGGIFNTHLTANLPRNLPVNFLKPVKIWQKYGHESVARLFGPSCIFCSNHSSKARSFWALIYSSMGQQLRLMPRFGVQSRKSHYFPFRRLHLKWPVEKARCGITDADATQLCYISVFTRCPRRWNDWFGKSIFLTFNLWVTSIRCWGHVGSCSSREGIFRSLTLATFASIPSANRKVLFGDKSSDKLIAQHSRRCQLQNVSKPSTNAVVIFIFIFSINLVKFVYSYESTKVLFSGSERQVRCPCGSALQFHSYWRRHTRFSAGLVILFRSII